MWYNLFQINLPIIFHFPVLTDFFHLKDFKSHSSKEFLRQPSNFHWEGGLSVSPSIINYSKDYKYKTQTADKGLSANTAAVMFQSTTAWLLKKTKNRQGPTLSKCNWWVCTSSCVWQFITVLKEKDGKMTYRHTPKSRSTHPVTLCHFLHLFLYYNFAMGRCVRRKVKVSRELKTMTLINLGNKSTAAASIHSLSFVSISPNMTTPQLLLQGNLSKSNFAIKMKALAKRPWQSASYVGQYYSCLLRNCYNWCSHFG